MLSAATTSNYSNQKTSAALQTQISVAALKKLMQDISEREITYSYLLSTDENAMRLKSDDIQYLSPYISQALAKANEGEDYSADIIIKIQDQAAEIHGSFFMSAFDKSICISADKYINNGEAIELGDKLRVYFYPEIVNKYSDKISITYRKGVKN